ncbi:hypothetical protein [Paenibacillus ehimensis]|uniref:Uncharacterized protein n=1 Tax=Paenibacillus ehimensis TaxID=79264 RepID=A0ABT8VAR8_9BACL|nr:hypothetical protein [Paenibacillus ehimensis]MDO3678063.1 hypothetical protein [Paenibacillus ehimensis]MEC0210525.1 hypothetical protein [Paenibacillus ehimensis]
MRYIDLNLNTKVDINMYLDEYNDYLRLYEMFGDAKYQLEARKIKDRVQRMLQRQNNYEKCIEMLNGSKKASWSSKQTG